MHGISTNTLHSMVSSALSLYPGAIYTCVPCSNQLDTCCEAELVAHNLCVLVVPGVVTDRAPRPPKADFNYPFSLVSLINQPDRTILASVI